MRERQEKIVYLVSISGWDEKWPSTKPDEFIKWFQDKIALVPEEYRDTIEILLDSSRSGGGDDDTDPEIVISYKRPETDEEMEKRIESDERYNNRRRKLEIEQYKKLKEKYGDII